MQRRDFLGNLSKGALAIGMFSGHWNELFPLGAEESAESIYQRALSIDALCFTTNDYVAYLTQDRIEALSRSGITAISLDVSIGGGPGMGRREFPVVVHLLAQWNDFFQNHQDVFRKILSAQDIHDVKKNGKVGIIFNLQDTTPIAQNLHRVSMFYDLGVRQIQLSHNQRNFVVDSCWEPTNAGLSRFGRELVTALNQKRILIDISHVGEQSCLDTLELSSAPLLASHTGCYALCPHPRNKSDKLIRALAESGGIMCIYNMSNWMTKDPEPSMDIFMRHLKHAINLAGEDHVGFGTDGDPSAMTPDWMEWEIEYAKNSFKYWITDFPQLTWEINHIRIPELNSPHRLLNLTKAMDRAGYKPKTIEKVIGGNYFRLFKEVVG